MQAVRRLAAAGTTAALLVLAALPAFLAVRPAAAQQQSQPAALEAVKAAVVSELQFNQTDKSIWMYRDQDDSPDKRATYETIETRQGTLRRMIELNGQPLTPEEAQAEDARIFKFVHDSGEQAKARRNGRNDEAQATEMLKMLPDAFIWTIASQDADSITLHYTPNPGFQPPDMQARVMSIMGGEMVIVKDGNRIRTLKGGLTQDVKFGFGFLGRLDRGGTFDVERRMVGNGHWQITESHVHIGGKALLFHTIGQQSDEVKTEWKPSPAETLAAAAHVLGVEK